MNRISCKDCIHYQDNDFQANWFIELFVCRKEDRFHSNASINDICKHYSQNSSLDYILGLNVYE